jgi:Ca2+/Na+ antiporter
MPDACAWFGNGFANTSGLCGDVDFHYNYTLFPVSGMLNESPFVKPEHMNNAAMLLMTVIYGVVLYQSSNLIADGSELLLLIPSVAGLVGSIVLPILGAVPDGMMTLSSGLGDDAQSTVGAGVGVLAGSTVMLLTFPWFIAVFFGRGEISKKDGKTAVDYSKKDPKMGLFTSGVTYGKAIADNAKIMLATTLIFLIIQIPAFRLDQPMLAYGPTSDETKAQGQAETTPALAGMIVSLLAFCGYLLFCFKQSQEDLVLDQVINGIANKTISLGAALRFAYDTTEGVDAKAPLEGPGKKRLAKIVRPFFAKYDADGSGKLNKHEFGSLLKDLDEHMAGDEGDKLYNSTDTNHDGEVEFNEFLECLHGYLMDPEKLKAMEERSGVDAKQIPTYDLDDEEEEEVPEDLAALAPDEQKRVVIFRATWMMSLGTFVVLVVSDPFVDLLTAWGDRLGIPAFYISFVVAPFASNASELLSAYTYAKKKNTKAMTTSLSTLIGAACMNNTFCLGIFFALIYAKGLAWQFTAETASIMLVQWIIGLLAMTRETMSFFMGWVVLAMYPFCLFFVYYLENVVHWD